MPYYSVLLGARNAQRTFSKADDAQVQAITLRHFPTGFTILNCAGAGYDPARRRFAMEESRQILVSASSRRPIKTWAVELAGALRQRELLVIELGRGFIVKLD
jgi:hypothetical protein